MNRGLRQCHVVGVSAMLLSSLVALGPLHAQKLEKIGATVSGAAVMLESRSVVRANGMVTATLRVLLQPPIKTASGELRSSRSIATFDCAKQTVATKETWYYFDDAGTKEGMHRKPGIPGFGPATKGSLADVAMTHLCKPAPASKTP